MCNTRTPALAPVRSNGSPNVRKAPRHHDEVNSPQPGSLLGPRSLDCRWSAKQRPDRLHLSILTFRALAHHHVLAEPQSIDFKHLIWTHNVELLVSVAFYRRCVVFLQYVSFFSTDTYVSTSGT